MLKFFNGSKLEDFENLSLSSLSDVSFLEEFIIEISL